MQIKIKACIVWYSGGEKRKVDMKSCWEETLSLSWFICTITPQSTEVSLVWVEPKQVKTWDDHISTDSSAVEKEQQSSLPSSRWEKDTRGLECENPWIIKSNLAFQDLRKHHARTMCRETVFFKDKTWCWICPAGFKHHAWMFKKRGKKETENVAAFKKTTSFWNASHEEIPLLS